MIRRTKHLHALGLASLCAVSFTLTNGCTRTAQNLQVASRDFDSKQDKLEELERSILKLTSSAYYENYYYSMPQKHTDASSQESLLVNQDFTTNSVAGTGLIVLGKTGKILILTCNHVFDFDDTVRTYYADENDRPTDFLQSLSVKYGQDIYVSHRTGGWTNGSIIAADRRRDIALIETTAAKNVLAEFPFQGTFKESDRIKLGDEIYVLGFPKGYFLVTKGLASPLRNRNRYLLDIPFNRGFSGGVAVRFDPGVASYEYVGMANSAAYDSEVALAPPDDPYILASHQNVPYKGNIYVQELKMINYGITFVISNEVIIDFLKEKEEEIRTRGYSVSNLVR